MIPALRRWFRNDHLAVWYHRSFRLPQARSGRSAMDPRRAESVVTWLLDQRITSDDHVHEAPEASFSDLRRVHDDEWLARVDTREVCEQVCGESPLHPQAMVELWRRGCGGTIEAARHVRDHGGRAANTMGGFHHAAPDRGSGFCALNDIATAIGVLRDEGLEGRILVLDLDAHPPDGLAAFALEDVDLRSVSVESGWTTEGALVDLRVPPQSTDAAYLARVEEALKGIGEPVMAFYLAGSDPLAGDPLGNLAVSAEGLRQRDHRVFEALGGIPTVVVPGGGYTPGSWKIYAHTLAEAAEARDRVAPDYDPISRRVGRVARTLAMFDEADLEITEADILGIDRDQAEPRFLDFYSRHGLEHAFVRYGIFDVVEQAGFSDLALTVRTDHWPHRLWVEGTHAGERFRVGELALRFARWEGYRLLFIDWLELKDPRRDAGPRKLPGQKHPGLGLAKDVVAMLGVAARRLNLAGLQFVPSHYHVAWIARSMARHPDPQARGEFLAFRELLADYPLGPVSRVLHHPGLPTEDGEMLTWRPAPMIHAIDEGLLERLGRDEDRARQVCRNTVFRLSDISAATFDLRTT